MALDYAKGLIAQGHARRFSGVSGGVFDSVLLHGEGGGTAALATVTVSGEAHYAAQSTFIIESFDPMAEGFTLPACYADLGSAA
jgi:proline racemase